MSERYSRLFTLPENLYSVGSPVVIAAGTLLKDNQTGKIIAQLKLKSISDKTIAAVKVKLRLFDTAGNSIEEFVVHDYLDLDISRDSEFAQKAPVPISNNKARSYKAAVAEVVFADRSVWNANGENWEPLTPPSFLTFDDYELKKQYKIQFGGGSVYKHRKEKDLWYCTCGALNHEGEKCHSCQNSLLELEALDLAKLAEEKDVRLEEEARQAAEKIAAADAQKKKTVRVLKITIPAVCAVIAIVLLITKVIIPGIRYNDAVALTEAGQYEEAIAAFDALGGYKDSGAKSEEIRKARIYDHACLLMKYGKNNDKKGADLKQQVEEEVMEEWERREAIRKAANPGPVARIRPYFWFPNESEIGDIDQYTDEELFSMRCYGVAEAAFQFVKDYADSDTMAQTARTEIEIIVTATKYDHALNLLENEKDEEAYILFEELGNYKDSQEYLADFREMRVRTVNKPDKGGSSTAYYYYNDAGQLESCYHDSKDVEYTTQYRYDENGNTIEIVYDYLSGEYNRGDTACYHYYYDEHNRLIEEKETTLSGFVTRTFYQWYNENGELISEDVTKRMNGMEYATCYRKVLDEAGNTIKSRKDRIDAKGNSIAEEYTESTYVYDANGNILEYTYYRYKPNGFYRHYNKTTKYEYKNGKLWKDSYNTYTYHPNGEVKTRDYGSGVQTYYLGMVYVPNAKE